MRNTSTIRALAIEGGGVLGIAYSPIISALESAGVLANITHYSGASAGAITAMMLAMGGTSTYVTNVIRDTPWEDFSGHGLPSLSIVNAYRALTSLGWHSIDYPRQWIADRIKDLGFPPDIALGQLPHHLTIATTNEDRGTMTIFSSLLQPAALVRDVVLASMAIPLYYPPVEIDGVRYSDGGLTCNHPMDVFPSDIPPSSILGLRLESTTEIHGESRSTQGVIGRALRLVSIARAVANLSHIPSVYWDTGRVIAIDTNGLSATDFRGARTNAVDLYKRGRQAYARWAGADEGSPSKMEEYTAE